MLSDLGFLTVELKTSWLFKLHVCAKEHVNRSFHCTTLNQSLGKVLGERETSRSPPSDLLARPAPRLIPIGVSKFWASRSQFNDLHAPASSISCTVYMPCGVCPIEVLHSDPRRRLRDSVTETNVTVACTL